MKQKPGWKTLSNYLFIGLMLFFVFNASAKAWVLQQLLAVGLFGAEVKKEGAIKGGAATNVTFYYTDAAGNTASTADLKGKVVLINFWASWCPPCIAEMPSLAALHAKLKDDPRFVFLFVNEDESLQKAKAFLEQKGYALPTATRAGTVPGELYSGTLPTTIILDTEGRVVMKREGLANYNTEEFLLQLKSIL